MTDSTVGAKEMCMKLQSQLKKYFLKQKGITTVVLFGSHAKGRSHSKSDVDLAVLFNSKISPRHFFDKSLKISCDLMKVLNCDRVDVIVLNTATPVLKNQIYKYGVSIFCKNPVESIRFKARAILEYLDMLPIRKVCELAMKRKALSYGR